MLLRQNQRSLHVVCAIAMLVSCAALRASVTGAQEAAVSLPPMDVTINPSLYPKEAQKTGMQGRVLAEFNITRKGKVDNVAIVQSEPEGVFDGATRSSLKEVKFTVPKDWEDSGNAAHRFRLSYVFKIYPCPEPCNAPKTHDAADDSVVISIQAPAK